jgi:hypothetical protein
MAESILTAESLRELLNYDPDNGTFTYRKSGRRMPAGSVAGYTNSRGYVRICIDGKRHQAHRLAWLYMTGKPTALLIDHIDGDTSNNVWSNLREATVIENGRNRAAKAGNPSGMAGVTWCHTHKKWRVIVSLGYFDSLEAARATRHAANKTLFGDFYRIV